MERNRNGAPIRLRDFSPRWKGLVPKGELRINRVSDLASVHGHQQFPNGAYFDAQ